MIPKYAETLLADGCTGVYVNGSSGEFVSMTVAERKQVAEAWAATKEVKNG